MQEYPLKEYKLQILISKNFSVADMPLIRKVGNKQKDGT